MKNIYVLKKETYNVWEVNDMLDNFTVESIIYGNPKYRGINEYKVDQLYSLMLDYMSPYIEDDNEDGIECDENIKEFFKCENDYQINEIYKAIDCYNATTGCYDGIIDDYNYNNITNKIHFIVSMLNGTTTQKWTYTLIKGVTSSEWNYLIYPIIYNKQLIIRIQDLYFRNVESYQAKIENDSKSANQIAKSIQKDGIPFIIGCNAYDNMEELKTLIKLNFDGDYEVVFLQVKGVKIEYKYTYEFC